MKLNSEILFGLNRRISLTLKMVVITVVLGVIMWVVFDLIQTYKLKKIFLAQLSERLSRQSMDDRLSFDRYVKAHLYSVKLFTSQNKFSSYVDVQKWNDENRGTPTVYKRPPVWFPTSSVLRAFIHPRFALLLDEWGTVREVYYGHQEDRLPDFLSKPTQRLLLNSMGQVFVTNSEGGPYLVVSERYRGNNGKGRAVLMIASPIDDIFLSKAVGTSDSSHMAALLTSGKKSRILTSSNPEIIPFGTPLEEIKQKYLVTGNEVFDYGASDAAIKFASFIALEEVSSLMHSISASERQLRVAGLPVLIISFALLMFWVTKRIQVLNQRITDFSEETLGMQVKDLQKGDQLSALEERFQMLTEEVLEARDLIRREAEERLLLEKNSMEMRQKEKELQLLQSVTQAVGVGVVKKTQEGLVAVNKQMDEFAQICGGLYKFKIQSDKDCEIEIHDIKRELRVFHINRPEVFDEDIYLVRDITKIKEQTEALEYMAMHDSLTGLPNRALLRDRLQHAIHLSSRHAKPLALLMMDLDRFKEINDTLGHHIGDVMLKLVGERLTMAVRKSDTLARLGGDEFAAVLPDIDEVQAQEVANKLLKALEKPFEIEGHTLYVGVSIGLVYFPEHGADASTLLKRADIAMYVAKNAQTGLAIYSSDDDQHSLQNLVMLNELQRVLEEDGLTLYYHPKICYESGEVSGVEALIRWEHPEHGMIMPDEFISLAEHAGLIKMMTMWVINEGIKQYVQWYREGLDINMNISINLSVKNLLDVNFSSEVERLLRKWEIEPDRLEFEITESAVMADPEHAKKVLQQLDDIGIRLSIDDFGTGYSSLTYLKDLPVDEIKIDKSFIMNMAHEESDLMIVRSIIDLAHNLGMSVIAEGVESREIWERLENLGCNGAQGHYICKPIRGDQFIQWWKNNRTLQVKHQKA